MELSEKSSESTNSSSSAENTRISSSILPSNSNLIYSEINSTSNSANNEFLSTPFTPPSMSSHFTYTSTFNPHQVRVEQNELNLNPYFYSNQLTPSTPTINSTNSNLIQRSLEYQLLPTPTSLMNDRRSDYVRSEEGEVEEGEVEFDLELQQQSLLNYNTILSTPLRSYSQYTTSPTSIPSTTKKNERNQILGSPFLSTTPSPSTSSTSFSSTSVHTSSTSSNSQAQKPKNFKEILKKGNKLNEITRE